MADYSDVFKKLGLLSNGDAPTVDQGMNYNAHPMAHVDVLGSMGTQLRQIANNAYATARSGGGIGELLRAGINSAGNDPMVNALRNNAQPQAPQQAQMSQAPADYKDWSLGDSRHQFAGSLLGDPLNFVPAAKPAAEGLLAGSKWVGKEAARQIEDGTGLLSHLTVEPRQYAYVPTSPSKPLPDGVGKTFKGSQVRELLPVKDLNPNDVRGASVFTYPADSTNFGFKTSEVSGNKINEDLQQTGSGGFPFGRSVEHQSKNIAFASNEGAAQGQHTRYEIEREANLARGGSGRILVAPTLMAQNAEGFSTQPVYLLDSMVKSNGMTHSDLAPVDEMVRNTRVGDKMPFANWVGMADSSARDQLLSAEGISAGKADLNKIVYEKYRSKAAQKLLGYNIEDLKGALLDPRLVNAPANHLGELWYEVDFNKGLSPSSQGSGHIDYTHDMGGKYMGTTPLKPTGEVFGQRFDDILARIPSIDKNGKQIPEATRQLNAINVLRSNKENAHLFMDDHEMERLSRLFGW